MPRNLKKLRSKNARPPDHPPESRPAEAITIAWTVSVTATLMANLAVLAAHWYGANNPEARAAHMLEAIMLLSAAIMGAISLGLFTGVWRTRRVKPPPGYTAFGVFVATAPIVTLLGRLLS